MRQLFNESAFEKRLPSGLFFAPGQGHEIGDGKNMVSAADAARLKRFPGWVERDVAVAAKAPDSKPANGQNASKGAITAAEAAGIDLAAVTGTGKDGQITKPDVDTYVAAAKEAAEKAAAGGGNPPAGN